MLSQMTPTSANAPALLDLMYCNRVSLQYVAIVQQHSTLFLFLQLLCHFDFFINLCILGHADLDFYELVSVKSITVVKLLKIGPKKVSERQEHIEYACSTSKMECICN